MTPKSFCTQAEVERAIELVNGVFDQHPPTGVKLELGLQMILCGLHEVSDASRPAVAALVLARLIAMPPVHDAQIKARVAAAADFAFRDRGSGRLH